MNLCSLSIKNVKNSISNYIMYFVSIVFSVFIFFSFKSIQYNESVNAINGGIKVSINSASVVIALFSFVFIYYSNFFFINRRKKEIGTYGILGMRKKEIGKMFLYENFIIGIVAIFVGIILGFVFSKLMTMVLVKLMGESIVVKMSLSLKAIVQTVIAFAFIFIVISIRNNSIIRKMTLIDLFKKETEGIASKRNPIIKGLVGMILIITAYIIAAKLTTSHILIENFAVTLLVILITIIPGTILFFSSSMIIILNLIKKNKVFYYNGKNLIAFSELSYKISSNSKMLSIIAILVATSITALGFNVSLYYDIDKNIKEMYPFSYTINAENKKVNDEIDNVVDKSKKNHKIEFDKTIELMEKEIECDLIYKKDKTIEKRKNTIQFIRESDFQSIMKYQNRKYKNLKDENDAFYIKDKAIAQLYENFENQQVNLIDAKILLNINKEYTDLLLNERSSFDLVVIRDNLFNKLRIKDNIYKLRIIDISNEREALDMARSIENIVKKNIESNYPFNITSSIIKYKEYLEQYGITFFIGIFLSAVFLLCTGSIILFKQLSSIYDDKERYITLKKVGAKNKDIQKILSKQLKLIFILPLLVGTIHSLFAMIIVQGLIPRSIVNSVCITLGVYYFEYFMYYFITLKYAEDMIIN